MLPECVTSKIKLFAADTPCTVRVNRHRRARCCNKTLAVSGNGKGSGRWPSTQINVKYYVSQTDGDLFLRITYSIIHHQMLVAKNGKYLGVTIRNDQSWNKHSNNVTKKANSTTVFLKRNIKSSFKHKEHDLQDICKTTPRVCLYRLGCFTLKRTSTNSRWCKVGHTGIVTKIMKLSWNALKHKKSPCQDNGEVPNCTSA